MTDDRREDERKSEAERLKRLALEGLGNVKDSESFITWLKQFIDTLVKMVFGDTDDTPNENLGDNEERESYVQRAVRASKIASTVAPKVRAYMAAHAGEAVTHGSPVDQKLVVTSGFGVRHVSGGSRNHAGLDLDILGAGSPEIRATAAGIVSYSGWYKGYGNLVEITHADGTTTRYAHMTGAQMPEEGMELKSGDVVGIMGNTGNSNGQHLHYEQRDKQGVAHAPVINGQQLAKSDAVDGHDHQHAHAEVAAKPKAKPKLNPLQERFAALAPEVAQAARAAAAKLPAQDKKIEENGWIRAKLAVQEAGHDVKTAMTNASATIGSVLGRLA